MPPYNANSACFNITEFNKNCCKVPWVSQPLLNFSFFFFPTHDCKCIICVSYLVSSLVLIGGLSKVCIKQKQIRKCSAGAPKSFLMDGTIFTNLASGTQLHETSAHTLQTRVRF